MKSRVFVTQFMKKGDFSDAERFGDVVFMTRLEHLPEPTSLEHNQLIGGDLSTEIQEYIQGEDYILLTPSQIPNMIVGALMGEGWHKILKWDNRHRQYRLHNLHI